MKQNRQSDGDGGAGPENGGGLVKDLTALMDKHRNDPHRGQILPDLAHLVEKHRRAETLAGVMGLVKGDGGAGPENGGGLMTQMEELLAKHGADPHRRRMLPELTALIESHKHEEMLTHLRSRLRGDGGAGPENGNGLVSDLAGLIADHMRRGPHRSQMLPDLAAIMHQHTHEQLLSRFHRLIGGEGGAGPENGGQLVKDISALIAKHMESGPHRAAMLPDLAALIETHIPEQLLVDLKAQLDREMPMLPFHLEDQKHSEWCWLAVARGVIRYWNQHVNRTEAVDPEQCELASVFVQAGQKLNCCGTGSSGDCNRPGKIEKVLRAVNIPATRKKGALTFKEVRAILADKKLPVIPRIGWEPEETSGHIVAIYGCTRINGQQILAVRDPLYPDSFVDYERFRFHYRMVGEWTDTILLGEEHA